MHFVIMLTMDLATTATIERIERDIAAVHHHHRPFDSEIQPHLTLAACRHLDASSCKVLLDEYAARSSPLALHFGSLGIFTLETAVIFAAPVVTDELLAGHAWFHQRFARISSESSAPYHPGNWVPHCTLAERVPKEVLPEVITRAWTLPLPLNAHVDSVLLAEFPAGLILHAAKLR